MAEKWVEITEEESLSLDYMLAEVEKPNVKITGIGKLTLFYRGQPVLKNSVSINSLGTVRFYANSEVLSW